MSTTTGELLIDGAWRTGRGAPVSSNNPSTGDTRWQRPGASGEDVADAVAAARGAFEAWREVPLDERESTLRRYAEIVTARKADIARLISDEAGKPLWESATEAAALAAKVGATIDAMHMRRAEEAFDMNGTAARTRYRPLGVLAVLGPFNLPMHMANGHIVPALLGGNAVVFKPSELTPACGELLVRLFAEAGVPRGVINLVQGSREVGEALAGHDDIDGLLFTGGERAGLALHKAFAGRPNKMLALELGGNNPLVVHAVEDVEAAALTIVQSAYLTAGQRCTCARRLIVTNDAPADLVPALTDLIGRIRVGPPDADPPPFCGPLITPQAAADVLASQQQLTERGGEALVECKRLPIGDAFLSPGIVEMTHAQREDEEIFGPLLQVVRVDSLDAAIAEANRTRFGLAAGLLADDPAAFARFRDRIKAGIVNWNQQLTGASGQLPFGGVGLSGNFRPSGSFAVDYCTHAVGGLENDRLTPPANVMGLA